MDKSEKQPETLKYVQASRISTAGSDSTARNEEVCVVREAPLTIDVEGIEDYTILCTPLDRRALAVGFLYTEGVIDSIDDITVLNECEDDPNTIRVRLAGDVPHIGDEGRNLMIVSSCGACGSENLKKRIESLPEVGNKMKIKANILRSVYEAVREKQELFNSSGGTHGAALFNDQGEIITFAEDTGRHNALDKAIGKCLLGGGETTGLGIALTSRLSLEMVSRCARPGIEIIAAVSAPTSLAIDVAQKCNITLCAFVRKTRATIFTHRDRIII
ncbi:MAG: formate dehydrogenase accessory sulfurtransferase FdhD [candidate division Zixibacteria bacterium]